MDDILHLIPETYKEQLKLFKVLKELDIRRAREDPAFFIEYAIGHEKTGKPIKNADFHREWQSFLSSTRWGVIIAPVEHGKSFQISIGRIIWELGRNPDMRILLIGKTEGKASDSLSFIRQQIMYNRRVHEVFPHLRRSTRKGDPWSNTDITVERSYYSRDPSVQARGSGSESIHGSRLDLIVYDDGLTIENTKTKEARDKHENWWETVVFSRLVDDYETQEFGRCFVIGTPFHEDDHLHRLERRKGWKLVRYCCVENPEAPPDQWRPIWPKAWPLQRILDKRDGTTLSAFARTLLCQVLDAAARRFKREWLDHCKRLGRGRTFLRGQPRANGKLLRTFTGVDIGIGKKSSDAETVFHTVAVDQYERRIVLDIESGRFDGPTIVEKADEKGAMFDSEVVVEGNQAQRFLADFAVRDGTFARAVNTGSEKWDDEYGVESMAVLMKCGLYVVPSGPDGHSPPPEADAFMEECWNFNPEQHTGDRLMAAWICDKGVREYLRPRSEEGSDHMDR